MFRSQIAEVIAGKMIGNENVMSAGTYTGAIDEPEGRKISDIYHHGVFVKFMEDSGYDGFGNLVTKRVTQEMIDWADVVVDMSEPEYDLDIVKDSKKTIFWDVENPIFQNYTEKEAMDKSKEIYSILFKNIENLLGV